MELAHLLRIPGKETLMTVSGGPTHRIWDKETVHLVGQERFYGDVFDTCHLKLEPGADPVFLNAILIHCTFDPPFVAGDPASWPCLRRHGCYIDNDPRERPPR